MTPNRPKYLKLDQTGKFLSAHTHLRTQIPLIEGWFAEQLEQSFPPYASFTSLTFIQDVPLSVVRNVETCFSVSFSDRPEAYAVSIEDASIQVYSRSERGLIYGALSLRALEKDGYIHHGLLYESPVANMRGAKVYLPGRENIAFFKEFVDFLVEFRMNTLVLEIGGAMEYKRHPEINDAWVKYCKEIAEFSGKADTIQNWTYDFKKNSIHVENGDGRFLKQAEVRELLAYCRERHIEVIPEVPSLSHSDYLLLAHPELREREEDDYADAYCPSNEDSYKLLFDVLDEVIDVFKPRRINIGHDELYSFGKCERCRGKDPVQLYTDDILRIKNYLAERNITTIIWADKLLDARLDGKPCGGANIIKDYDDKEYIEEIPALYPSADRLPTDLGIFHWYWGVGDGYDEEFHKRGFRFCYANFSPLGIKHWRQRMERGIEGAIVSNWSTLRKQNIQRNGIFFDLAFANLLMWEDDYTEGMAYTFARRAMDMLYAYNYRSVKHGLRIVHTTDHKMPYRQFYDGFFIVNELYRLGAYHVRFTDGTETVIPVEYGLNISCSDNAWEYTDRTLPEVTATTLPRRIKCGEQIVTAYEFIIETPGVPIASFEYIPHPGVDARVDVYSMEVF